jgi:energy-coupling factor transporter ATP-binding protein EcfA2
MLLRFIEAENFLPFGQPARLDVHRDLTVVTGPNGAGKSSLGRCLDVARAVVASATGGPAAAQLDLYQEAGYEGADSYAVRLGLDLDQPWERGLIFSYVRACYASETVTNAPGDPSYEDQENTVTAWLMPGSLEPLWSGTLVIRYQAAMPRKWSAAWEFTQAGDSWHAALAGEANHQLRPGRFGDRAPAASAQPFKGWLLDSKPSDKNELDFRAALLSHAATINFSVRAVTDHQALMPASIRELAAGLGLEHENRGFSFDQVMSAILERGITLTDNRRMPVTRRFALSDLDRPADLRDGAAIGAELFRLKNGSTPDRARFRQVQDTFKELTGRDLEVRARSTSSDDGAPAMIIEPTVVGPQSERLVELSGAGIQEALVLSALLHDSPGRVTVLDEPAVNLEPTIQRRLTGRVHGPGQYIVITHNADLVPFEDHEDLDRIVRIAPNAAGSRIIQPARSDLPRREQLRQFRLHQPAEIRSLLFAPAVIIFEGETELGALPRWWRRAPGLPDPVTANLAFISAPGDSGFGPYIRFLDTYGIPWAIVADGPAFRSGSKLDCDLHAQHHWPARSEPSDDDFTARKDFLEHAGVYTLATQFGTNGTKKGELEEFLKTTNRELYDKAAAYAGSSKPTAGRYFAIHHPDPPPAILDLYKKIIRHLKLDTSG